MRGGQSSRLETVGWCAPLLVSSSLRATGASKQSRKALRNQYFLYLIL
jgi:hypothetical protein